MSLCQPAQLQLITLLVIHFDNKKMIYQRTVKEEFEQDFIYAGYKCSGTKMQRVNIQSRFITHPHNLKHIF